MNKNAIELNGKEYSWPKQPIVVVTIDGGDPAYLDYGFSTGIIPNIEKFSEVFMPFEDASKLK